MSGHMDKAVALAVKAFNGEVIKMDKKGFEILPNGALVIARDGEVVLAMWDRIHGREYITWKGTNELGYHSGHYFMTICPAVQDYEERRSV